MKYKGCPGGLPDCRCHLRDNPIELEVAIKQQAEDKNRPDTVNKEKKYLDIGQHPSEHPNFPYPDEHNRRCSVFSQGWDDGGSDCDCFYNLEE